MFLNDVVRLNGRKYPDRPAIVSGDRTTTFGELRDSAWQVANAMRELGRPGDRVGILAENLPEYVECYYGVPAAGMALTFLNYRLHPKEWAWILNNAEASVLLVQAEVPRADRAAARRRGAAVQHIVVIDDGTCWRRRHPRYRDVVGAASTDEPPRDIDEDATAWLLYTSGTTGFPKGAMLTHRNLTVGDAGVGHRVRAAARRAQPRGVPAVPRRRVLGPRARTSAAGASC